MKGWNVKLLARSKAEIKSILDQASQRKGCKGRYQAIIDGLRRYENSLKTTDMLYLYIYIISALVHQSTYGGFRASQINGLKKLAFSLLKIQQINPQTSKLGVLYGELHLAISQVNRSEGLHWSALWEEQISVHLSRKNPVGNAEFHAVSRAIRALRVGQADRALSLFCQALNGELSGASSELAEIGIVRTLRLSAQFADCRQVIKNLSQSRPHFSDRFHTELQWEHLCLMASMEGDLGPMLMVIKKNSSHYKATYIIESLMWSYAIRDRSYSQFIPKAQTVAQRKGLNWRNLGFFFRAALDFETCLDTRVPLVIRLNTLGKVLGNTHRFVSVDRELLFYVAAIRWLAKNHSYDLAQATLMEYEGINLKLSNGKSTDVLNLVEDMHKRFWYKPSQCRDIIEKLKSEKPLNP